MIVKKFVGLVKARRINKLQGKNSVQNKNEEFLKTETTNAEYYILPTSHLEKTEVEEPMANFDGVVIENGKDPMDKIEIDHLLDHSKLSDITEEIKEEELPIYLLDLSTKQRNMPNIEHHLYQNLGAINGIAATGLALAGQPWAAPLAASAIPKIGELAAVLEEKTNSKKRFSPYLQTSNVLSTAGMRSALFAQKAEDYVAEEYEDKPSIMMVQGSSHNDTKFYLDNPKITNYVVDFHEHFNCWYWDEEYIDKIEKL